MENVLYAQYTIVATCPRHGQILRRATRETADRCILSLRQVCIFKIHSKRRIFYYTRHDFS
jgi:hypothetical protein